MTVIYGTFEDYINGIKKTLKERNCKYYIYSAYKDYPKVKHSKIGFQYGGIMCKDDDEFEDTIRKLEDECGYYDFKVIRLD